MQICTELWFMEHARAYGQGGVHLLAVPRATPRETLDKWLAGGRAAAIVSGAFTLSSNSASRPADIANLGGQGWIVGPDGHPRDVKVARSLGMGLDQKAIDAVKRWKFEPAMKDGKPVAVQINVEVNFRLY